MKFEIDLDDKKVDKLLKEVMENYPEASFCLRCIKWKYDQCKYKFLDEKEDKEYLVTLSLLRKGFEILIGYILKGKYHFEGLDHSNLFDLDGGDWDAIAIDALVQCAIFGDVIYG